MSGDFPSIISIIRLYMYKPAAMHKEKPTTWEISYILITFATFVRAVQIYSNFYQHPQRNPKYEIRTGFVTCRKLNYGIIKIWTAFDTKFLQFFNGIKTAAQWHDHRLRIFSVIQNKLIWQQRSIPDDCKENLFYDIVQTYKISYRLRITRNLVYLPLNKYEDITVPRRYIIHLSHITRKCVFGDFRPGNIQTSLLSYRS